MSLFCENSKSEMLSVPLHSRRQKTAFLSALVHTLGSLVLSGGGRKLTVRLDNPDLKKTFCALLDGLYKDGAQYTEDKNTVTLSGGYFDKLMQDLKIFTRDSDGEFLYEPGIHKDILEDSASLAAYLRGLFLGAGAVTLSKGYHLEFGFTNGFLAAGCAELLKKAGFKAGVVMRKGKTVVYSKDSQAVSDILAFLGAAKAVLKLNDVYARRAAEKLTNRRLNCDMANIDKTVAFSAQVSGAIRALEESGEFLKLDGKLRETAELRLENPGATLTELAAASGITKSGIRHRLQKLTELAAAAAEKQPKTDGGNA